MKVKDMRPEVRVVHDDLLKARRNALHALMLLIGVPATHRREVYRLLVKATKGARRGT